LSSDVATRSSSNALDDGDESRDNYGRMRLMEILTEDRVLLTRDLASKRAALDAVASLLARASRDITVDSVRAVLEEREALQSTGIGDGVAIPHGFLPEIAHQVAALVVSPSGVPFDAIDGRPATIIVGVLGPKRGMHAQVEHLRILARVSKVLRESNTRAAILVASSPTQIFQHLRDADAKVP
jgi:PTS system nitrogen regulatory IIA component